MNKLLLFVNLIVLLVVVSCVDNTFMDNRTPVIEGVPTTVQLTFESEDSYVVTRSEQNASTEKRVNNLYVFVFDANGDVHFQGFFNSGNISYKNSDHSKGSVSFETTSLSGATIVGIANLVTATTSTAYNITETELDAIKKLSDLKTLVMTMNSSSVLRGGLFMMTGYAKDEDGHTIVDITDNELGAATGYSLQLERTDAKVRFEVRAVAPTDKKWTNFSFTPTAWTVKQVPLQSLLLPSDEEDGALDAGGEDEDYFTSATSDFDASYREMSSDGKSALYVGGYFVFYMPENRKIVTDEQKIAAIPGDEKKTYSLRGKVGDDGQFVYAPLHSTYVEISGQLSYFDENDRLVYANIKFTIHLGYKDKDPNDYQTLRNHSYTYKITISGVEDIKADVEDDKDVPGYDGEVVESFQNSFEFDCHYDRRLIKLNKSGFQKDVGALYWGVSTPFSKGIHKLDDDIPLAMRDYRWIKFAINKQYNVDSLHLVKYPGDQNYVDPYPLNSSSNADYSSPYYSPNGDGYSPGTENARLLDVDQLMRLLEVEANKTNPESDLFDQWGNVHVTAFVDENVYIYNPTLENPALNMSLWKEMAETDARQLYIIVDDVSYSGDGQSVVIKAQYSFRQRSVRTIYNVKSDAVVSGWGLESVMETGRLGAHNVSGSNSTRNGLLNTVEYMLGTNYANNKNLKWTEILGTKSPYELNGEQTAMRACLLRNRDLNGDNIVDYNEIRWYLASIDQLTDIYIGEYALDELSRLYPREAMDRENQIRWHYISSSVRTYTEGSGYWQTKYEPWIIWAEEGASRGGTGGSKDDDNKTNTKFSYRCVRNLGLSVDDPKKTPDDFVSVSDVNGGKLIDLSKMNVQALRSIKEVSFLPSHNERDKNNMPYVKFRILSQSYPSDAQTWKYFQTYTDYQTGYRIPNQRELLIATTRIDKSWWYNNNSKSYPFYMCQTAFSLKGESSTSEPYSDAREGFYWDSSSGNFILQNSTKETGYVRPVQDVAE